MRTPLRSSTLIMTRASSPLARHITLVRRKNHSRAFLRLRTSCFSSLRQSRPLFAMSDARKGDSKNDSWLCYGDFVCLSTRAGRDSQERKYLLGHHSPLTLLQKVQKQENATDFASIILAENPATIAFSNQPETSKDSLDMITNARDYWFEVLPRTDYDMSSQLNAHKKQLGEFQKKLQQLEIKRKEIYSKRSQQLRRAADTAPSTLALNPASGSDIHMSSPPPTDAVVDINDSENIVEMQPLNSVPDSGLASPDEVTVKVNQTTAVGAAKSGAFSIVSRLGFEGVGGRRQSVSSSDGLTEVESAIEKLQSEIADLKAKVTEYKVKTKQEQNGNAETITRMHGDPLNYGNVIQLCHVTSKRLLSFNKTQDRPVELSEYGKPGSLFYIERVSTGVAGGSAKIPAQASITIRLKSFVSDSQYVRMEPNNSMVPGTKFGVSLDVELDGVFNADESFQLGTGAASNDNRVDWILERCKKNSNISTVSEEKDDDAAEDEGVAVDEILSGCQIIRLYHRASESYLAAVATKMDRGKVFYTHRSQSDSSQGSGKIANTYWMVIDGDGDMADSGENVTTESPIILQHVVTGMVLVAIRHLPALESFKATNSEEYLSDDEEAENAVDDEDEQEITRKRAQLDKWISKIRTSVASVLEYCGQQILPTDPERDPSTLADLCDEEKLHGAPFMGEFTDGDDAAAGAAAAADMGEMQEYLETVKKIADEFQSLVRLWHYRGETLLTMLKTAGKFLSECEDLSVEKIKIKALEIEYELQAWFKMPVFMNSANGYIRAVDVVNFSLKAYKAEDQYGYGDVASQSGVSAGDRGSVSGASAYTSGTKTRRSTVVASVTEMSAVPESGSVVSATGTLGNASETASLVLNNKSPAHPLETLRKIITLFKERDKKEKVTTSENPWTLHIMAPKRLRTFRSKLDDIFATPSIDKEKTSKFLLACRWKFSRRHDKSGREGDASVSNNTLFGLETNDCDEKDGIFLLGSDFTSEPSQSAATAKRANLAMISLGPAPEKKSQFFESPAQQQFEQQLCNIEFVSSKNADKIRNGSQVSSIIRNFCAHLKFATDKRDLNDNDLEYYMSFVRRYNSRLQEAFDVVSRSCLIDGFQPGATSDQVDSQGQLFFGSLGIVELAFSVIQPLTEQLGWQIEEEPPFFTHWKVRPHHAKVLHFTLAAISATTTTLTKSMADEFFKRWRRQKKNSEPWADDQMQDVTREVLEELGFPPLKNEAGNEVPRVAHNLFKLFAECNRLQIYDWNDYHGDLILPSNISISEGGKYASPKSYVEAVMSYNFPKLLVTSNDFVKKVQAVERNFRSAFADENDEEGADEDDSAYTRNAELMEALKYAMKPSDFDFFWKKHIDKSGLYAFKAIVSPAQASRIRTALEDPEVQEMINSDVELEVNPGERMFFLEKTAFNEIFEESFRASFESIVKDGKVLEFDKEKAYLVGTGSGQSVRDMDMMMMGLFFYSEKMMAQILKCVALDDDNTESPWNDLPIFFNFKDSIKYQDFRDILIAIVRRACACVSNLVKDCQKNAKKLSSSQIYYVIKNLLPRSSDNQLNIAVLLSSILKGNFSAIDRMFTDAVYSSLLQNMNDLRSNAVPIILQSLVTNRDGSPDYGQQMRVLKSIFQTPYAQGHVIIPRIPSSYVDGEFSSLRLVFDSTYGLAKTKNKPTPKDHPFAYIKPPQWAKTVDGEKRFFVEPWDVLLPVTRRSGVLGKLYGTWFPPQFFELKAFAHDFDCLEDFGYFSEIKKIEKEWEIVHSKVLEEATLDQMERDLKRDWWYCTMKLHLQFLCSCYSLVAKLCANRNQQAWDFFYGSKVQTKKEFLVQTWGSRPSEPIICDVDDDSCCSMVSFGVDGLSTVAAVTNLKPMNPSCGFEIPFPSRRFMYYEVTIDSFEGPETKAMLQLGWTVAGKERNSDQPSDGNGAGDFAHSWGFDGIRTITYDAAQKLLSSYETQISDSQATLVKHLPQADDLKVPLDELRGPKLQEYIAAISALWTEKADSMRSGAVIEEEIAKTRKIVEKSKHMLRSRILHRTNIMAQMAVTKRKWDTKIAKEGSKGASNDDGESKGKLEDMPVDRGLLCFHTIVPEAEIPDVSFAFLSDSMEATLKKPQTSRQAGQPSLKWSENNTIGVWVDLDACEIGIVRSELNGGKQTLFRRSDTAFFDDLNSVSWKEDDIVPCISGKGVNVKVNLGIAEGESNDFKYFNYTNLVFETEVSAIKKFEVSEIKNGKFITTGAHNLKNGQYIRLEIAKTAIVPKRKLPAASQIADPNQYTYKNHGLQNNQLVIFINQHSSSHGIEEGEVYLVKVEDDDSFSTICKVNLQHGLAYRVKINETDPPNAFEVLRIGIPDETYISDPLQLPRVILNGKVARALWGPYGETAIDVTELYNGLYDGGLRNFGNLEAVYKRNGKKETIKIKDNLKHFFKPTLVSIQAFEHAAGVFTCENHGLKQNQFVQFGPQDPPNSIKPDQAYTVHLENGENHQFRLNEFHQDEMCFLKIYHSLNLPDTDIGNTKYDSSGKVQKTSQKSLKYALPCTPFRRPSKSTSAKIPNFAFSNGIQVLPDYGKLSDIIFCPFLPACLRASSVELLRSCFIDQEPWFLTPPINTIRAFSTEPTEPALKYKGGYLEKEFKEFSGESEFFSRHYKIGKQLPELCEGYVAYCEDDVRFFEDVFNAAGWKQSQEKVPKNFGHINWDDGNFKKLSQFLLDSYRRPKTPFELCTRDIAIFWGRVSCLLWEKSLKSRFLSEQNQDIKIFLKNLIHCLLDTLRFEFDESWKGIIAVRKILVSDLELCALSYFKQTDIAHDIADILKKNQNSASSDSASSPTTVTSSNFFMSCFRRTESLIRNQRDVSSAVDEEVVETSYKSPVPDSIIQMLRSVSDQSSFVAKYSEYSRSQGNRHTSYEYFDWLHLSTTIAEYRPSRFNHEALKKIFAKSSGDLLLALCDLMSVSWQVMVDDKITEFLDYCTKWEKDSLALLTTSNSRAVSMQYKNIQYSALQTRLMKTATDFFEKEKSNSTKSKIDFINQTDVERTGEDVDWFDVIPALANIPKTSNMASKLCIQLHSFPKEVFQSIQKTKIITGQDSEILNKLEVELRILRHLKEEIRICFFNEDDLLDIDYIPNETSFELGESWKSVERLIAQLCREKEYDESASELQSWVNPNAARLFVPNDEDDPNFARLYEIVDDSGGIPPWEESLEYIEMLHDSIVDDDEETENWTYDKGESPYFMIKSPEDPDEFGFTWHEFMKVYTPDQQILEEGDEPITDNSPAQMEYQCELCNEGGCGYCFCFLEDEDDDELRFIHPACVYARNLPGKSCFEISPSVEEQYKSLYDSNKGDQDVTWSNERRTLIVAEIKKALSGKEITPSKEPSVDSDTSQEAGKEEKKLKQPFLDTDMSDKSVDPDKKKEQLQKAMLQLGIIDVLVEIVKIKFPKKYSIEQADEYNQKMQKRMRSRRINYLFETVNATSDRVSIVECLIRRVFFLLAQAAAGCLAIQNRLYDDIDFFFSKALEPTSNDSALCIFNMIQGNLDNATAVPTDLLTSMVKVAQDGQNPDDILLLAPFMAQGDKNISVNQREILELCIPAEYAIKEECMFILDSDFPSESSDKSSFEKWKNKITSVHVNPEKSNFGENPWDLEHDWKHLLRVASDIVHGGYASTSEPCRSAFHMAFIQTLMSCGFNNPEERQNIVLRLPFIQILHILNTVCSLARHRIWGQSFIDRCTNSLSSEIQEMGKVVFKRDPRLNFLNFDLLLTSTSKKHLVSHIHFFNESGTEELVRRTSEGLPLYTSAAKVSGFITWIGVILKDVVAVFQRRLIDEGAAESKKSGAGVSFDDSKPSTLDAQTASHDATTPSSGAGVLGATDESGADDLSKTAKLSMGTLGVISKFKAKAHSYVAARAFAEFDDPWYRENGDITATEFDNLSQHPTIGVALNQIWTKIFGIGVNFETKTKQSFKLGDRLSYESRCRDIESSPKFCRPFWRCPISHAHFTKENLSVLALAVSSVLFDQVPMEWKQHRSQESILGALQNDPVGYVPAEKKRPNVSDVAEAQLFILAVELLIQEMCADPKLRWINKKESDEGSIEAESKSSATESPSDVEIKPLQVLNMLIEGFNRVLETKSFASRPEFKKYLHKGENAMSWPTKLSQSTNETSAIVLIEKKVTQWNIIRLFRASFSDGNPVYNHISVSQAPVIRRCLSFALVYNWGAWGGIGSEVSLKQMKLIIESIGSAALEICQIAIESFPSFVQQLFQRFEAPKMGSAQAKECNEVGDLFLKLEAALKDSGTSVNQADCIKRICAKQSGATRSPLDYLVHVGETLKKSPKDWSHIDAHEKSVLRSMAVKESNAAVKQQASDNPRPSSTGTYSADLRVVTIEKAYSNFLTNPKIDEILSSTVETNAENLMFRFLAIDTNNRLTPVHADDSAFCFYGKFSLTNSTKRDAFPKYLNYMVYNILSVLGSLRTMPRGEDTNQFIATCLQTFVQIVFCGACVNKEETDKQFGKLAKNKLVLDSDRDSESFFARTCHVQECMVGLLWLDAEQVEAAKKQMRQFVDSFKNPTLVTDSTYKMALRTFSFIANLVTPAAPNNEIRAKAMHALSCMLDNCSAAVLDRFFDSKDAQVIHSTSNVFARSLQQFIKDYEDFKDRDDDLTICLEKFRKERNVNVGLEDEFIRKLIEFETTDWLGDAAKAKSNAQPIPRPDPNIKAAYESFSSKSYTTCLFSLRLLCQMCVQSGKTTRASYPVGQKYMINQPNSDPALIVDFSSSLNSVGSLIAGRMRLATANVFDIRILCRLFKAYNSIIFGAASVETQRFLVAETFTLINKTVSGLSQRIDDMSAPFFPSNHPINVLEQMLTFLTSFALSDIDGKICKQLSKSISWINFFNLISQMHSAAAKHEKDVESNSMKTKSQIDFAQYYKMASTRICDSAYILYSAVKRRDISKSALLEKDWRHANLDTVAAEAQLRVSCVEIVRTPGNAELCFFTNPEKNDVGDDKQRQLLCLEDSKQLSLRKNLVICEQLRNRKTTSSGFGSTFFKILRNVPLILTTLINLLLLGWLNLPVDFSSAAEGWRWPQNEYLWERLVPNITSEDGSYTYEEFQSILLPNVLPLSLVDEDSPDATIYRNGINMTFLLLAGTNIFVCFFNLIYWLGKKARVDVYEYLLTSAYDDFLSPTNKSKKRISLEDLSQKAGGRSFLTIFRIPAFWGRLVMFTCSLCILLISPLFSVLFVCDGFRFPGISYIFGAFSAKAKEFLTLGYLTASIIFINSVIGLVFFWDLFSSGENEAGSSECTTLFQCTLSFIVLGWQGGGLGDLLQSAKDTPQGTPTHIGDPRPSSYRLLIALFWQLLYFIVVPTCLVSTVVGIISDSFGDARQKKADWKDTMSQYCFVCGRSAADFRDAGLVAGLPEESIVTFEDHVTTEHCVKDYFKLFVSLKSNKNPDLLTAQEHFVLQKINSLDESFFPMDLSISLDAMKSFAESESSAAEKQEKRLDGFEGKLEKVVESVDQVQGKMLTQDDLKDMKTSMMSKEDFREILQKLEQIQSTSMDLKE